MRPKSKNAIYPGSFDPITNGHVDLIHRGLHVFDTIVVAVAINPRKSPIFTAQERVEMIQEIFSDNPNVQVDTFEGLLVEYARHKGITATLRGLRAISDFEYEFQMALTNRKLFDQFETFFLMSGEPYTYLSSGLIREISNFHGNVEGMVPKIVVQRLKEKYREKS